MKVIVCDLDGSLMNPSSGLFVSANVKNHLIQVQKKGVHVILNSARCFQGVYPLSKQIQMQDFNGYIISCNGAHCYCVQTNQTIFEYCISHEDAFKIWRYGLEHGFGVGFSQPDYFVANKMTKGFKLDMQNCDVDYILTNHPKKYLKKSIWKVCISDTKEKIDACYESMKKEIESLCDVKVVHSTDTMIDIIHKDCEKLNSVERLLREIHTSFKDVSAIGDGISDTTVLKACGYGVTLENGCKECQEVADKIVPSCYEDGCIEWLKELEK